MKLTVALLLTFMPALALANLSGDYHGTGSSLFNKTGTEKPCSDIFLNMTVTVDEVKVDEAGYSCSDLQAAVDPFTLKIKEGRLISEEGFDVGTITDDKLDLRFEDKQENFVYEWHIAKTPTGVTYLESWTDAGTPSLTVEGSLTPR